MEDLVYPIRRQTSTAARWMDKLQVSSRRLVNTTQTQTQPTRQNRSTSAGTHRLSGRLGARTAPAQQCSTSTTHEQGRPAREKKENQRTGQGSSPDKGPGGGVPLRSLAGGGVSQLHGRKSEKKKSERSPRSSAALPRFRPSRPPGPGRLPVAVAVWRWYPRCFSSGQQPDLLRPARPPGSLLPLPSPRPHTNAAGVGCPTPPASHL